MTQQICAWLHLFGGGNSVHNYYVRVIIDKRIVALGTSLVAIAGEVGTGTLVFDLEADDNSSAGGTVRWGIACVLAFIQYTL